MARCSVTIFTVVSLKPGLCSWHVLKSIFIKSVSRLSWKNTNYHYSLPGFIITTASHTSLYSASAKSRKVILSLQYVASYNKLSAKKFFQSYAHILWIVKYLILSIEALSVYLKTYRNIKLYCTGETLFPWEVWKRLMIIFHLYPNILCICYT